MSQPIGAAGQCTARIITPGLEELGVWFRCWNTSPCADHPPTEHPKHRKEKH